MKLYKLYLYKEYPRPSHRTERYCSISGFLHTSKFSLVVALSYGLLSFSCYNTLLSLSCYAILYLCQTASGSNQPFCHSTLSGHTQTDRPTSHMERCVTFAGLDISHLFFFIYLLYLPVFGE